MPCPENTSEKIIQLLSAFELEDVMERAANLVMEAGAATGAAVLMWDTDLESIADRMFFGSLRK